MPTVINVLRLFLGIVAGLLLMALIPIYSDPFSGCQSRGFTTLELGCSLWLDALFGFGAVLLVAFIGPNRLRPHFWGLALVTLVAVLGGPAAIESGVYLDIWSEPSNMVFYWRGTGVAMFLGGLIGVGLFSQIRS